MKDSLIAHSRYFIAYPLREYSDSVDILHTIQQPVGNWLGMFHGTRIARIRNRP